MIYDAIAAALPGMQAQAESLMQDRCIIRAVTGTVSNPDATTTPTYTTVYEGRCKVQNTQPWPSNPQAGEHTWNLVPTFLHLPVAGSQDVGTDHVAEILTSVDPANVGRTLRIRNGDRKTFQTAVRFITEEITG